MDLLKTLFDVIDTRSFSNIWYWMALAALWSTASHYILGVPSDLISRAKREGGQALSDVEDLCRVNVTRICEVGPIAGAIWVGLVSMLLSSLAVTGFAYRIEFAQALFLLLFPLTVVGGLSVHTAHRMYAQNPGGLQLCRELSQLRLYIQALSLLSIFVTAIWGMSRLLAVGLIGL